MILEVLEYLATPCPGWARQMGYLRESIAIRHRARRCRNAWAEHQARTRAEILKAAETIPPETEIIVLGAGLCLDVPVQALADRPGRLTLVDAIRPLGLRLPADVRFMTGDVEGSARSLYEHRLRGDSPMLDFTKAGLIVSVNLISQLPLLPVQWCQRHGLPTDGLAAEIMGRHVTNLAAHPAPALLIGDAVRRRVDSDDTVLEEIDLARQAGLPSPETTWTWPVVPAAEAGADPRIETEVGVWRL